MSPRCATRSGSRVSAPVRPRARVVALRPPRRSRRPRGREPRRRGRPRARRRASPPRRRAGPPRRARARPPSASSSSAPSARDDDAPPSSTLTSLLTVNTTTTAAAAAAPSAAPHPPPPRDPSRSCADSPGSSRVPPHRRRRRRRPVPDLILPPPRRTAPRRPGRAPLCAFEMFLARVGADDPASPAAEDLVDVVAWRRDPPSADRAARALVAPHLERIRAEAREMAETDHERARERRRRRRRSRASSSDGGGGRMRGWIIGRGGRFGVRFGPRRRGETSRGDGSTPRRRAPRDVMGRARSRTGRGTDRVILILILGVPTAAAGMPTSPPMSGPQRRGRRRRRASGRRARGRDDRGDVAIGVSPRRRPRGGRRRAGGARRHHRGSLRDDRERARRAGSFGVAVSALARRSRVRAVTPRLLRPRGRGRRLGRSRRVSRRVAPPGRRRARDGDSPGGARGVTRVVSREASPRVDRRRRAAGDVADHGEIRRRARSRSPPTRRRTPTNPRRRTRSSPPRRERSRRWKTPSGTNATSDAKSDATSDA